MLIRELLLVSRAPRFSRRSASKVLTLETINPNIRTMEYAVRGPLVIRAVELEKELEKVTAVMQNYNCLFYGASKPFKSVIRANIGDAHAMGQQPITFVRQLLACITDRTLLKSDKYPTDVKARAKEFLASCGGGSIGAYTHSTGVEYQKASYSHSEVAALTQFVPAPSLVVREHVASFISRRDNAPSSPDDICISGGASDAIRNVFKLFVREAGERKTAVLVPIPQYPLYSALIAEYGLVQAGYYLDESKNWGLEEAELERALQEAEEKNADVRALVVINPGNPTGQVLSREDIEMVVKFAHRHNLFVLADEVYQDNVYAEGSRFHSFNKITSRLGPPLELASFHSVSKGFMGECGLRGGYVEFQNLDPDVYTEFKKMISAKLCSTVLGQAVIYALVNRPHPGESSYSLWLEEKTKILQSLKERAGLVREAYDNIEGVSCNEVQGAMYAFPRIHLPPKAVKKAESLGQEPDFFYAMQLLEETGVCIIPGSGFGQKEGTFHFRTTILPQIPLMREMLNRFKAFHFRFMSQYS